MTESAFGGAVYYLLLHIMLEKYRTSAVCFVIISKTLLKIHIIGFVSISFIQAPKIPMLNNTTHNKVSLELQS